MNSTEGVDVCALVDGSLGRLVWWLLAPPLLVVFSNLVKGRAWPQLQGCQGNLKEIATALEMYASDNGGRYPRHLERVVELGYLKRMPTCRAAGAVTYLNYRVTAVVDERHEGVYASPENFPNYDAERG